MKFSTRALLALCLVLVAVGFGVSATAAGAVSQADDPTNATRTNESVANTTAAANATANVTVENVTVWTGQSEVADRLTNRSAIERAQRRGALRPDGRLFADDTLVFELRMPGLDHRLAAADGPNETSQFFEATHGPESWIAIRQTYASTIAGRQETATAMNHANASAVVTDPRNHTYYVRLDLESLPLQYLDADETPFESGYRTRDIEGKEYYLEVAVDGERTVPGGDREDGPHFEILDGLSGEIDLIGGGYLDDLESRRNLSVRLSGPFPSDRTAKIRFYERLRGMIAERTVPLIVTDGAEADELGPTTAATATFDLRELPSETGFEVVAFVDGSNVADQAFEPMRLDSGRITLPENQTWTDGSIRVRRVSLSHDAILAVSAGPLWAAPELITAVSGTVELGDGPHRNVTIPIRNGSRGTPRSVTVFAVVDTNENGRIDESDEYLIDNETVVGATAPLADRDAERRGNVTADPNATTDRRTATSAESVIEDTATSTGIGTGFGVLAMCVAISLLIALGRRR